MRAQTVKVCANFKIVADEVRSSQQFIKVKAALCIIKNKSDLLALEFINQLYFMCGFAQASRA